MQKTWKQQYYLSTSPRPLTPYTEGRWSKYYSPMAYTKKLYMMLYKNMKVKVCSLDGDTEYIDIVTGVLQGDPLAPYLFIICLDYVLRISIDKNERQRFQAGKQEKQKIPRTNNYGCGLHR